MGEDNRRRDDGDDGLVGKILNQVDLLVGKRPDLPTVNEVASGRRRDELARDAAHQQHSTIIHAARL